MPKPDDVGVGVCLVLYDDDDMVMLRRRDDAGHAPGCWSFPGGWMERGEKPQDTAAREALEEVGVVVDPKKIHFMHFTTENHPNVQTVTFYMWTDEWKGKFENKEPDKVSEVRLVNVSELDDLDLFPGMEQILPRVKALADQDEGLWKYLRAISDEITDTLDEAHREAEEYAANR